MLRMPPQLVLVCLRSERLWQTARRTLPGGAVWADSGRGRRVEARNVLGHLTAAERAWHEAAIRPGLRARQR